MKGYWNQYIIEILLVITIFLSHLAKKNDERAQTVLTLKQLKKAFSLKKKHKTINFTHCDLKLAENDDKNINNLSQKNGNHLLHC